MSETMTAKDFQESVNAASGGITYGIVNTTVTAGVIVKDSRPDTKQLLRMMGDYFELDKKAVNFWIRQMELDKKL